MNARGLHEHTAGRLCSFSVLLLSVLCAASAWAAPKTDVVVLFNGDRLTGEVKGLAQGKLTLKTDNAGTVSIEWDKIVSLKTLQRLQVQLASGEFHFGSAPEFGPAGKLLIDEGPGREPIYLPLADIVIINPLDQGKLKERFDGYLTAGYTYTKSNNLQEFNLSGGVSTKQERRRWSLDGSTTFTAQSGRESTQVAQLSGVFRWSLDNRWFWQDMFVGERNEELGLDARGSVGAATGRYLVQNGHHEWTAYAGLLGTSEKPAGEPEKQALVGLLGTQYTFFQYDTPERTVSAKLEALPGLTESRRVRGAAGLVSRWEIVKDFILEVSMTAAYDSAPGEAAKSHTDYELVTSLGYTF